MAQGYTVGTMKNGNLLVVQAGKRVAGKPTPWITFEQNDARPALPLDTRITHASKAAAVRFAEGSVAILGAPWEV